jgi:hypothetical protein
MAGKTTIDGGWARLLCVGLWAVALTVLGGCAGPEEGHASLGLTAGSETDLHLSAGLRAMLADERDIARPRPSSPRLGARRDQVLRAYIAGKPTASVRAAAETAKLSPVGGGP